MLSCPNCGHHLTKKNVRTASSGTLEVDFCAACGGVFFDKGEVNRISSETAEDLSQQKLSDVPPKESRSSNICPKCGSSLERYFGESVPADVYVLRCPMCSGAWFQKQELEKFKKAQEAKINYFRTWKIPLPSLSAVLMPVALLIALSGAMFLTVKEVQRSQQARIQAQQTLSIPTVIPDPEARRVAIAFTTRELAKTDVSVWTDQPLNATTYHVSVEPALVHQLVLRDLVSGKEYFYQIYVVTGEESLTSQTYSFKL